MSPTRSTRQQGTIDTSVIVLTSSSSWRVQGMVVVPDRFGDILPVRGQSRQLEIDVRVFRGGFPQGEQGAARGLVLPRAGQGASQGQGVALLVAVLDRRAPEGINRVLRVARV